MVEFIRKDLSKVDTQSLIIRRNWVKETLDRYEKGTVPLSDKECEISDALDGVFVDLDGEIWRRFKNDFP